MGIINLLMKIWFILICFLCLTILIFGFIGIIDLFTIKEIGIEKVPCIDKSGRPFENELCEKKIYCSSLGLAGSKKCSEVDK